MKYPTDCPDCGSDIIEEFGNIGKKEGWYFQCCNAECRWKRYLTRKELTILLAVDE